MNYIVHVDDLVRSEASLIGNKAATVGVLRSAALPIPDGFCVTAMAMERVVQEISGGGRRTRPKIMTPATPRIQPSDVPPELLISIAQASANVHHASNERLFAVRSSATIEDSLDLSFAGQFYTGFGDASAIVLEMCNCWASLYEEAPLSFSEAAGVSPSEWRMAVLVQDLIPAEKAGVMFTANPVTGATEVLIEASWGLGSSVVGGQVTPDQARLGPDGELDEYRVGSKRRALMVAGGKICWQSLTTEISNRDCLTERDMRMLFEAAKRVEEVLGLHQDIEFAFHQDKLWILQARPITGLPMLHASE